MQAPPSRVGHIYDDLTALAAKIHQGTGDGAMSVWVSARGEVIARSGHEPIDVPADAIVGTYSEGAGLQQIEEDLRLTLRARAKDWIITVDEASNAAKSWDAADRRKTG